MRLLTTFALGCALLSCGASPRWTYLGNRYFEYCHHADLKRSATDAELAQCWQAWLDSYAVGQSRERIEHAKERRLLLAGGEALRLSVPSIDSQDVHAHDQAEPHPGCPALCDTQYARCADACAAPVDEMNLGRAPPAGAQEAEANSKPAGRGSDPVTGSSATGSGKDCLPACDQEKRVCRQGCL